MIKLFFQKNLRPLKTAATIFFVYGICLNGTAQGVDNNAAVPATTENTEMDTSSSDSLVKSAETISISYRNAPIGDILRSIAENAGINIALPSDLPQTPINLQLNNVTIDVALTTILQLANLGAKREKGVLIVDTQENIISSLRLQNNRRQEQLKGEPTRLLIYQVRFAKAEDLESILKSFLERMNSEVQSATNNQASQNSSGGLNPSSAFGSIGNNAQSRTTSPAATATTSNNSSTVKTFSVVADKRTNKLIVEAIPEVLKRAKALLTHLDKRKAQVNIQARIIEATSKFSKDIGIKWGTRLAMDGRRGFSSGQFFPSSVLGGIAGPGGAGVLATGSPWKTPDTSSFGFTLGSINSMINLDAVLRASEQEDLVNIISSPQVSVQDQNTAIINESGKKSKQVPTSTQVVTVSQDVELKLEVRPQVTGAGFIELEVDIHRSFPTTDIQASDVSGVAEHAAKTKLLVANGETAVIGGLYSSVRSSNREKVPLLSKIPILGFLFRSSKETTDRSELMVLITPRLDAEHDPAKSAAVSKEESTPATEAATTPEPTPSSDVQQQQQPSEPDTTQ